ncbi:putative SOS response-associated peptidase YedK [Paraburkholderia sp. BL6669N2]|uniref:SOS response-associated peptidase family protein n=1 Tax=Paraburkholderia sp. BL6669N2 TaxID=1938807 RepID=UPI000E265306|nr:SOS response-associated peptidase family protein [Paraburkholderia sp. BL6669N2]REG60802.1 putative SOS response-associated peptidase YedK [Paraburkholderia sp. BL6669N2]
MCYSAQVLADYRKFVRAFGALMDIHEFARLFFERAEGISRAKIPKAMEEAFSEPQDDAEREIKAAIDKFNSAQSLKLEQDLFKQRKRLADAGRTLQTKITKAATESQRIATDKIAWTKGKLEDLQRTDLQPRDSRIFPGHYAPVMVMENGRLVVKPMRYQCRIAGKPASYDIKYPGTYNARRDSLEGFWAPCFGRTHAVLLVEVFYENVSKAKFENTLLETHERDENVVLEFRPSNGEVMHVACLWSRWSAPGQPDLLSFAAITDEPPPEVAAAGHDRCIVPIKPENVDAWLNPDPKNLDAVYAILDDRDRPYFEHRLAA